ncbi:MULTISPECIES: lysophospholipid acyltransferase family protein [Protofrankia]|uniref:Phospholipid/glycerol acyltransferase n=1 Tax=Candidatus Protofrankia datiscae TaxID=2716812 RepID=F8B6E6_9ACTN|nr:phospholipid/glycerol acyltransferase [Candidatus Protofrankia datiscae]
MTTIEDPRDGAPRASVASATGVPATSTPATGGPRDDASRGDASATGGVRGDAPKGDALAGAQGGVAPGGASNGDVSETDDAQADVPRGDAPAAGAVRGDAARGVGSVAGAPRGGGGPGGGRPSTAVSRRAAASRPYNDILHTVLKPLFRLILNRVVMRLTAEGLDRVPPTGPLIFASNHSSLLDGPLVVIEAPRTVRCLVKSELYTGILGRLLLLSGQIPINRGRPDRFALHTALDELSRGGAIGVFPEGTRGSGEVETVQHGIAYLAVHGRCPIVPVACVDTGQVLPRGAYWPRRSVHARMVFGHPFEVEIPANPRSRKALAEVAEGIRVRLADHLAQARLTPAPLPAPAAPPARRPGPRWAARVSRRPRRGGPGPTGSGRR